MRVYSAYSKTIRQTSYGKWFLILIAVTTAIFLVDPLLLRGIQSIHHPIWMSLVEFGAWFGRGYNLWFLIIGTYIFLTVIKKIKWARRSFGVLLSVVISAVISFVVKRAFLRARPDVNLGHLSFFHLNGLFHDKSTFQSFPSGDVAIVAGAAAFLFYAIKNQYLRWAILAAPVLTALSRMSLNRHWPSDTVFPFGMGLIVALLVWQYQKCLANSKEAA